MKYVIGMDIGTSGLKSLKVNMAGDVVDQYSVSYHTEHPQSGYSEMNPEVWYDATIESLKYFINEETAQDIVGISFSGQMHGLVMIDAQGDVIRPAILWNDTRTANEVQSLLNTVGLDTFLAQTQNTVLEGFTLPKLMWVRRHEPDNFAKIHKIMLPKDYIAYRLTGNVYSEPSDASGTSLFNVKEGNWAQPLLQQLDLDPAILPDIIPSHGKNGDLSTDIQAQLSVSHDIAVYQGGADNACGALGSGITDDRMQMVSIGTSGVALAIQNDTDFENDGSIHYFNHCVPNQNYIMGVTLSAGYSLGWLKKLLNVTEDFDVFLDDLPSSKPGANGLLFTPYLLGERTPYNDTTIRSSFIGLDATTTDHDLKRAVIEGITFSIHDSIDIIRQSGKPVERIVSIGGGAKNATWLQMQADIFNASIRTLAQEQGPAYGAAMLAAMGAGWFDDFQTMREQWITYRDDITPNPAHHQTYEQLFPIYQSVYKHTQSISEQLLSFK
ncbi:xylulose kinase [Staphylococcus microti]|uniref:Xylulose kinase n=1 Tax=Staphylococcus microti TaxID=569857 RepID=A0A0D6XVM5_9STAP|nr:xylulokinase [Staphylococcus microti]KIX91883.1 xylulose kinase [Staphylococcus microti]PNZ84028.1 xylulokinase [Staphylococcus microti]SUM56502.1 gluconokinase [Staphylococcus microti]